ncbi:hypothetical protein QQZ08_004984 [Neonectria magnoliae]|uniref:Aromatic amino acid beta-eliminating lyase/threonine aldolase domain-containing protein n=1 Tax=Neonectria magnoliae TaxID=2732573 RepID=A0ABR1I4Y5_9HYPO
MERPTEKAPRDFRSDVPTETIMHAILEASVNDDIYDTEGDPSVRALKARVMELTGKEAELWVVSDIQGNQICLRTHLTQPPHTVLLDHHAHVHFWESGALPVMSKASVTIVYPQNGVYLPRRHEAAGHDGGSGTCGLGLRPYHDWHKFTL